MIGVFRRLRKLFKGGRTNSRLLKTIALAFALNLAFGAAFYAFESPVDETLTPSDAFWWAMVTMTTVGYGDFMPTTLGGRYLVAYPCFLVGIGLIAYLVGTIAEAMIENVSRKRRGLMSITESGHVVVCNFPNVEQILRLLEEMRAEEKYRDRLFVLVTDKIDELPEELVGKNVQFVKGDPTREEILHRANVLECDGVMVLAEDPGNPDSDLRTFAVGTIIELIEKHEGRAIKTIVEMLRKSNTDMINKAGVDGIVSPEDIGGALLVQEYLDPGVCAVVEQLITTTEGSQFYLYETHLLGHKVRQLQQAIIEHPTDLQIVGVLRQKNAIMNPPKEMTIEQGDKLVLLAKSREDFQPIENDLLSRASA